MGEDGGVCSSGFRLKLAIGIMITDQVIGIGFVTLSALITVLVANGLSDRLAVPDLARRIAGALGGFVFLIAILMLEAAAAIVLILSIAAAIALIRSLTAWHVRGLRKSGREKKWGEVIYLLAAAASLTAGWGIAGDRWLAFVPIGFMAWGDNIAGVIRSNLGAAGKASVRPSMAMLLACLAIGFLYEPYWIAAVAAVAAVFVERFPPTAHPLWDDNWAIVATALTNGDGYAPRFMNHIQIS